jgi:hypothetical protein
VVAHWLAGARAEVERTHTRDAGAPAFSHVLAYTARDEAQRALARLILVPPYTPDGRARAYDADIVWRAIGHSGVTQVRQTLTGRSTETILAAPFTLDASLQPQQWEVETRMVSGAQSVSAVHRGPCINPPIQRWIVRYAGHESWRVVQADVATRLTISEPYEVPLDPRAAPSAEANATITVSEPMTICCDTWTNGSLSLEVDGHVLAADEPRATLAGVGRPWPVMRFGPLTLPAGQHTVTARLTAPEGSEWMFGVLLVDDAGAPLIRCAQVTDGPPLDRNGL